jgi:uncharacterized membrane protein (DUF485 family)
MKIDKKILFLTLLGVLVLPSLVSAQSDLTIQTLLDNVVKTTMYIASAVVVILWVITGILFLSAQGAPEKLNLAKNSLLAAVVGTILVIIAGSAIYIVGTAIGVSIS